MQIKIEAFTWPLLVSLVGACGAQPVSQSTTEETVIRGPRYNADLITGGEVTVEMGLEEEGLGLASYLLDYKIRLRCMTPAVDAVYTKTQVANGDVKVTAGAVGCRAYPESLTFQGFNKVLLATPYVSIGNPSWSNWSLNAKERYQSGVNDVEQVILNLALIAKLPDPIVATNGKVTASYRVDGLRRYAACGGGFTFFRDANLETFVTEGEAPPTYIPADPFLMNDAASGGCKFNVTFKCQTPTVDGAGLLASCDGLLLADTDYYFTQSVYTGQASPAPLTGRLNGANVTRTKDSITIPYEIQCRRNDPAISNESYLLFLALRNRKQTCDGGDCAQINIGYNISLQYK